MLDRKKIILLLIFLLALALRFLYFPQNTYFGFDQARDAFAVKEILNGHLKVTGPSANTGGIHHGVLYYYIFSPFYFFSGGDPEAVSAFLRVINASGVFILYFVALILFGSTVAIFASFLFAISYEQTQFSLFLNHPSLAIIAVLIFYLGLANWIFRKKAWGLYVTLFGLGLSIQFHFLGIQFIAIFFLFILFFWSNLPKLDIRNGIISVLAFFLPVTTFIVSEIKDNFIIIKHMPSEVGLVSNPSRFLFFIYRHIHDNFAANNEIVFVVGLLFLSSLIYCILKKIYIKQMFFLALWFFGGLLIYFFINNDAYFYNFGTSIALLVFAAFLVSKVYSKNKLLAFSILFFILISNIFLITKQNPMGPNQKINPQIGLLLKDQQEIIDFIYGQTKGEEFAVNALTMPYNVNTTWSYLFEWYGKKKYGYVPIWGGDAALGFPGNLKIETARSKLPNKRFLIIEPLEGIPSYLINSFIINEENYTNTTEKKNFGTMQVWVQSSK